MVLTWAIFYHIHCIDTQIFKIFLSLFTAAWVLLELDASQNPIKKNFSRNNCAAYRLFIRYLLPFNFLAKKLLNDFNG